MKKNNLITYFIVTIAFIAISINWFCHLEKDPDTSLTDCNVFYTDEGWHSGNAVSRYLTGNWLMNGPNHMLLMPTMPLIQYRVFTLLGLSLASARLPSAVISLFLVLFVCLFVAANNRHRESHGDGLMRDERMRDGRMRLPALVPICLCLFLLGSNIYFFVFGRLALLDVPMSAFGLFSLFLLYKAMASSGPGSKIILYPASGVVLAISILTKSSAFVFVVTMLFVLALRFYFARERRKQDLLGILSSLVIAVIIVSLAYPFIRHLTGASRDMTPAGLIGSKIVYNPLLIGINYVKFFSNQFLVRNGILFLLALASFFIVTAEGFKDTSIHLSDMIMGSLLVASFLFLGYFTYQPPRYFLILIIPLVYFVSTLPINIQNVRIYHRLSELHHPEIIVIILILAGNTYNVFGMLKIHLDPRFTIPSVARAVRHDILADKKGERAEDIILIHGATLSLVNQLIPYETPSADMKKPIYHLLQGEMKPQGKGFTLISSYTMLNNYKGSKLYLYRED
ncbi:MAG: phospholipid carrier-dependent glycosyltransferase [bacterium]